MNTNDNFIEKRAITLTEHYILIILENMAAHGLNESYLGYTIDLIYLGERGIFRVLCKDKTKLYIGRINPPRIRSYNKNSKL